MSIQQQYGTTPLLLHRAARQWRRSIEILQENTPQLAHFLEIRYEDLLDKPEEVINKTANFLNLKELVAKKLTQNHSLSTLARQNTKRLAQMSASQRAIIKNCVSTTD